MKSLPRVCLMSSNTAFTRGSDSGFSGGLIVHGANDEAITLLSNFATDVFSPGEAPWATNLEDEFSGQFQLGPNPSQGQSQVYYDLPAGNDYSLQVVELSLTVASTEFFYQMARESVS